MLRYLKYGSAASRNISNSIWGTTFRTNRSSRVFTKLAFDLPPCVAQGLHCEIDWQRGSMDGAWGARLVQASTNATGDEERIGPTPKTEYVHQPIRVHGSQSPAFSLLLAHSDLCSLRFAPFRSHYHSYLDKQPFVANIQLAQCIKLERKIHTARIPHTIGGDVCPRPPSGPLDMHE